MESKKINQLATELSPALDDLTIIGDPTTGISRKITLSQMASLFTGTVEEYASLAAFPLVGTADTIYIALDTNVLYRWNGSAYVELSPNIVSSLEFNDANGFDGTINLVGSVATLTITTALTLGSLPFIGASGALSQDNSNLFYDDTNNRLGIGTNAPTTPLDVFGSGIISRINGTSTNNAFLGFSSAGSNKWSVGNVQSDHRFRIFSEANTAELVSLLQTGEFGIGIANPTTKLHLDGGASALIANLDANVSVAKSISFRSDNSNRINLEVSGTESGSNAGANFFIRRYSDAGALIDTPLTITRSTGLITLATALSATSALFKTATNENVNIFTLGGGDMRISAINDAASANVQLSIQGSPLLFRIGGGTEAMRITSDGNIGVGTATPKLNTNSGTFLTVQGTNANAWLELATTSTSDGIGGAISFNNTNIAGSDKRNAAIAGTRDGANNSGMLQFVTWNAGSAAERMRITSGGNVLIGTTSSSNYPLEVEANASGNHMFLKRSAAYTEFYMGGTTAVATQLFIRSGGSGGVRLDAGATSWVSASDERLKNISSNIENATEKLNTLRAVNYTWKSDKENSNNLGLIAQDVIKVFPELVSESSQDGMYGVKYTELIPVLVKAIQELKAEIDLLKGIAPIEPEAEPIVEPTEVESETEPQAEPNEPDSETDTETQPNN
jgi:hypothetical protein